MGRFEGSRKGKKDFRGSSNRVTGGRRGSRDSSSGRDDHGRGSFSGRPQRRTNDRGYESGRGSFRDKEKSFGGRDRNRGRGDFNMTRVTCSSCGKSCEVPFKPTSDKPVFCSDCFKKPGSSSGSSGRSSGKDFAIINEKLDKIMDVLGID